MTRKHRITSKQKSQLESDRSEIIGFEGLRHAPENELGVVFLFSKIARRFGFVEIDRIRPQFPDCWVIRKTAKGTSRTWIEFEFNSRSFKTYLPQLNAVKPRKGIVVCWEHNWPECERHAEVIELRALLDFGRRVWIQSTKPEYQGGLDEAPYRRSSNFEWTVSSRARPGDLVLMYRAGNKSDARKWESDADLLQSIANIFMVKSRPRRDKIWGHEAEVAHVALLKNPLRLEQMRMGRILKQAPFIRASMIGRWDVTPYWYRIHDLIVRLDRPMSRKLRPFAPDRI